MSGARKISAVLSIIGIAAGLGLIGFSARAQPVLKSPKWQIQNPQLEWRTPVKVLKDSDILETREEEITVLLEGEAKVARLLADEVFG